MGLAYKAPQYNYRRSYYVSTHVVDRLRLRNPDSDAISDGVIYRDHTDLMNRIDEAIKYAIGAKKVDHVWDKGEHGRIVNIDDWFLDGKSIYILLKRDAKNERAWAAVTVFTESQFESNKRIGRWIWSETPHPEMLPLRSQPVEPKLVPASVSIKPAKAFAPLPPQSERRTPLPLDEMVVFFYQTKDGQSRYERAAYREAAEHGKRIVNDPQYSEGTLETYGRLRSELKISRGPIDF